MNEQLKEVYKICPRCEFPYYTFSAMSKRTKPRNIPICSRCGTD